MIALSAVALAAVLVRFLLAGSAIDLGPAAVVLGPAVLALAVGWGLVSRARLPDLADSLGLALLVPARGLLCDVATAVWPSSRGAALFAALLSLGPLGFMLGRTLSSLVKDGVLTLVLGWMLGEVLCLAGAVGWMPGALSGFVVAGALAALVELGRNRRGHGEGSPVHPAAWDALPLGVAFALLFVCVRRIAPSYAEPDAHLDGSLVLLYLLPACVVLVPVRMLAGGESARRGLFGVGCLALAFGIVSTLGNLDLARASDQRPSVTWAMFNHVWDHPVLLDDWRAWLLFFFVGSAAAGLGLVLGALRRASAGPFVLGLGLGLAAEQLVLVEPLHAPVQLLLVAAGVAAVTALAAVRRRLAWTAPLGLLALALMPESPPGFDGIARVGEPASVGFVRTLPADVVMTSAFGPEVQMRDSRRRYAAMFTKRVLVSSRAEIERLTELWLAEDSAQEEASAPRPGEYVLRHESDAEHAVGDGHDHELEPDGDVPLGDRHFGLRVAGAAAHPGHDPLGPEGSLGRLTRLFGVRGPACVFGVAAELPAADLVDAALCAPDEVRLASPTPLSLEMTRVLLNEYESAGYIGTADPDPRAFLREQPEQAFATVVVTPERGPWPDAGSLLALESLERLRDLLRPGGRCLAWIDTSELDARALGARLAAFGEVFGEDAACFVEMRGLDAPFLLALGWVDARGRPATAELEARLPTQDATGSRSRLADLDDLAAMLLFDARDLAQLAEAGPVHRRGRPVTLDMFAPKGWGAVELLLDGELPAAQLARVVPGATDEPRPLVGVAHGMAIHATYSFHLALVRGSAMFEIVPDIDWDAFERELAAHAETAAADSDHPLLHVALATLFEALAVEGDYSRFAAAWQELGVDRIASWRLQLIKAKVLREMLQGDAAWETLDRARELAGLPAR